jgi:uncharacterized SAM-binding protein YcdF (DUF218 family)
MTVKNMKKIKKILWLLIVILILQFPLFYKFWLGQMGGGLIYQDKIAPADCILVLGGGRGERVLQGVELYKKKYAPQMMMTGEFEQVLFGPTYHWALQGQKLAVSRGVPKNDIIPILTSMSTHDDATLAKTECLKHNYKSLIVVSEPFHTKRAYYTFKKVFKGSGIKLMIYPVQGSWWTKDNWYQSEKGLIAGEEEYIKLLYYLLKGYI